MNLKELKELIEMLKNTDISELEIERSGFRLRIGGKSAAGTNSIWDKWG